MTELDLARAAYGSKAAPVRTHRGSEYEAFARVTARLRKGISERPADFPHLASALHENRELWTVLASDVAGSANGLPPELRARLFYLAEFVDKHSGRVLQGKANGEILVEINATVMKGLRTAGASS